MAGRPVSFIFPQEYVLDQPHQRGQRAVVAVAARVELRDENGNSIATLYPTPPLDPNEPLVPWDPTITREELERRMAEPAYTFEEARKMLGWA